ncbi:MAG TPA: ArgE/DapE family deacylase [Micromonosporaceae bacterium]|jgi:acetylornithine deacetylase|nr:ArgE/DapE family deacylase [Micromonosporaceae bacterium]
MTTTSDRPDRVLEELHPGEAVDLLTELVRIPSISGSDAEQEIQAWLADWLRREGLEVDHWPLPLPELTAEPEFPGMEVPRDAAWGLVARLPGTRDGRSLMFNGHVDVVPPGEPVTWRTGDPFAGVLIGDDLHGRGACDMKGGLTAALLAVRALRRSGVALAGDVLLACVVGEEDGGLGTYATLRRGWRADACVIAEPTGLDVVSANGGALTFRLRVPGLAAHASRRTEGVSAVERFWPVFSALRELERRRNSDVDPVMSRWDIAYPIEIGTVTAGDWASTVPNLLVAEGRLGVALNESMLDARAALEQAVAAACADDPWLRDHPVVVEWWGGQFAPARLPAEDGGLLERVRRCHAVATGGTADVWGGPYGSDLRLLTGIGGIPTVQYGPGDVALAHAVDEFVPVPDVLAAARTLTLIALDHHGMSDG